MTYPLLAFLTLTFSSAITPGPNNIMSMTMGQKYGFKKSFIFIFGAILGHIILLFLLGYLNKVLFTIIPAIQNIMSIFGTIYLIYLAWIIYNSKGIDTKSTQENVLINKKIFISAFFFQFINPKAILFSITIFSTYAFPYFNDMYRISLMVLVMAFAMLLSLFVWSAFGSLLHEYMLKYRKSFNTIMASLLLYCALSIAKNIPFIQQLLSV
ncbi:MAG: LysE family transporter [Spirochaetota bacterium]|nr:LysE family transporter [Spirochaetota bacterium]